MYAPFPLCTRQTILARFPEFFRKPKQSQPSDSRHLGHVMANMIRETTTIIYRLTARAPHQRVVQCKASWSRTGVRAAHVARATEYSASHIVYRVAEIRWDTLTIRDISEHPTRAEAHEVAEAYHISQK